MTTDIKELKKLIDKYLLKYYFDDSICYSATRRARSPQPPMGVSPRFIDDLINERDITFQEKMFNLIDSKGLNDVDVYNKAHIDRRLFSKIRSNVDFKPSKKTAISICFGLELNIDETLDLLSKAGYTLSNSSKSDLIIRYFIENQEYDIDLLNQVLYEYGLDTLYY